MKKFICLLLSLLVMLTLFACSSASGSSTVQSVPAQPSGTLLVSQADAIDPNGFDQVFTAMLDPDGEHIALHTDGLLQDFALEFGNMDDTGMVFQPEYTIFSAKQFTADTLICLNTYFSDTMPTLRVSFTGAEGSQVLYLFQSGKDGSILLTEN